MENNVYICQNKHRAIMQFETGKTYYSRQASLAGVPSGFTVVKRNDKTITIQMGSSLSRRSIVINHEGVELVKQSGRATSNNVFADNR